MQTLLVGTAHSSFGTVVSPSLVLVCPLFREISSISPTRLLTPYSVICLESLQDKDMIRNLPCGHIYHSDCIAKWFLKQHDTCPLCKTHYVTRNESDSRMGNRQGFYEGATLFRVYQTVSI